MNRVVAIAVSLLTLALLASCGDASLSPSQVDIDATVEARVAKALAEPVRTPTITSPPPANMPVPTLTFADSVIAEFSQPSFGVWTWRTGYNEDGVSMTVGTSHQDSGLTLFEGVVALVVPFTGNPVVDEYSALYVRTLTALSCPEKDMDNSFWRRIDTGVNSALTFRSRGEIYNNRGQYIPAPPTFGNRTLQCRSKAVEFRGLSLYVLEMAVADTASDIRQLWREAVRRR